MWGVWPELCCGNSHECELGVLVLWGRLVIHPGSVALCLEGGEVVKQSSREFVANAQCGWDRGQMAGEYSGY